MFKLNKEEFEELKSQIVISSIRFQNETLKQGAHSKYLPNVFTEQGDQCFPVC